VLLLGYWNRPIAPRIVDAALKLRDRGLARHLAVSTHQRSLAAELSDDRRLGALHIRYNAEHRGAEQDLFPKRPAGGRPGMVAFTATSWGRLLDPRRIPPGERVPCAADCYRFVLANPNVDVCMTGPSSEQQVTDSLAALDSGPMPPDEVDWMRRVGASVRGW
jgi:aryl-alcohol dehydrogenase-like predicted oxidoreductase